MSEFTDDVRNYSYGYASDTASSNEELPFELNMERPASLARKFIEVLFYLATLNSAFLYRTGLWQIRMAGFAPIAVMGLAAFIMLLSQREKIPFPVWCAILLNITVNLSRMLGQGEAPFLNAGGNYYMTWLFNLVALCYLVQNENARKRILIFLAAMTIGISFTVGELQGARATARFAVKQFDVEIAAFRDPNGLAYGSATLAVAILFWSLRSRNIFRPLLWASPLVLMYLAVMTLSRGGTLALMVGLSFLAIAIMLGRGVRIQGALMIIVGLAVLAQAAFYFTKPLEQIEERFAEKSVRTRVYSLDTLTDMADTLFLGRGPEGSRLGTAHISAHNSYIYTHVTYGGASGLVYLVMVTVISVRMFRMAFYRNIGMDVRLMVIGIWLMAAVCQIFSNMGYMDPMSVYAYALAEKYTAPFSRQRILERNEWLAWQSQYAAYGQTPALTYSSYS